MLKPLALAPLALLFGCTEDQLPQTAEDTITYTLTRLGSDQDPGVVWDLLPPSYQGDVRQWCRRLGTELPGKTYDKLFLAMRKTGIVIKTQGEKLLNFGPIRYFIAMARGADEDDMLAMFNALGNIPILLGNSEIASVAKLKSADIGRFLHDTGSKVWEQGARAFRVTGESVGSALGTFTYKTIKTDGDRAQLELAFQGETRLIAFTRVEGHWLPTDLVDNWAAASQRIEAFLDSLDSNATRSFLKQLDAHLDDVMADLDMLQQIKRRGKFYNELARLGAKYGKSIPKMPKLPK
jgi:hypothetical protein